MADRAGTRPFAVFEWTLALRYLRARRREAFISVIAGFSFVGIMLGVATLIIVMAVMNGFRIELLGKMLGVNGHLILLPTDTQLTDYAEITDRVSAVPGVTSALPLIQGQVLVSGPSGANGALVKALREEDLPKLAGVAGNIRLGSLDRFDIGEGVAIGTRLAETLGVTIGSRLTLVTPNGPVTPFGSTPQIKAFRVAAIFEIGMSQFDSSMIFMPLSEAQAYFNMPGRVSMIEIYVNDPDKVADFRPGIEAAARKQVALSDWRQRDVVFFSALEVERNVMFLILTLIVLVAALNIISGLTMLVKDKSHDIAILRTMGATRGAVMRIFFMTGAAIGTLGTVAGLIIGTLVCVNIEAIRQFLSRLTNTDLFTSELYFLSKLPAQMDVAETVSVVLMAIGLSYLATLYPAWRAARLDPVEALRYE